MQRMNLSCMSQPPQLSKGHFITFHFWLICADPSFDITLSQRHPAYASAEHHTLSPNISRQAHSLWRISTVCCCTVSVASTLVSLLFECAILQFDSRHTRGSRAAQVVSNFGPP